MLLVRRDPFELRRLSKFLRRLKQGHAMATVVNVHHEVDKSCCKQEELSKTMDTIREEVIR